MLWTPIPKSLSAHVICLFSYLVKILCGDRSFVAMSVQVIWFFGYLVEILCGVAISKLLGYLVIWWTFYDEASSL